jgi:hypothetical protein
MDDAVADYFLAYCLRESLAGAARDGAAGAMNDAYDRMTGGQRAERHERAEMLIARHEHAGRYDR